MLCQAECHAHPYTVDVHVWQFFSTTDMVPHLSFTPLLTTPLPVGGILSLSEVACHIPLSLVDRSINQFAIYVQRIQKLKCLVHNLTKSILKLARWDQIKPKGEKANGRARARCG